MNSSNNLASTSTEGGLKIPTPEKTTKDGDKQREGEVISVQNIEGGGGNHNPDETMNQSIDLQNLEEDIKTKQNKEQVEKALLEVYLSWSEEMPGKGTHRTLQRYDSDLKGIITVMKSYAYSDEANDPEIVNAVYEYIKNAQEVYVQSLMLWLQENDGESTKKVHPATPRIKLLHENVYEKCSPNWKNITERLYLHRIKEAEGR